MGKSLGEVPQQHALRGIDLLREQPEVIGVAHDLLEEVVRVVEPTTEGQGIYQPEATEGKGGLTTWQSILGAVPVDKALMGQLSADLLDRRLDPRVSRR